MLGIFRDLLKRAKDGLHNCGNRGQSATGVFDPPPEIKGLVQGDHHIGQQILPLSSQTGKNSGISRIRTEKHRQTGAFRLELFAVHQGVHRGREDHLGGVGGHRGDTKSRIERNGGSGQRTDQRSTTTHR